MTYDQLDPQEQENLFRRALANGDIEVHFQPVINAIRQDVTGFEALARWETDALGKISPTVFLPIVEQCDLSDDFGAHVLQQACYAASRWQKEAPSVRVAVNVSQAQFVSEHFVPNLERALERTGLKAGLLDLEVTGAALAKDPMITDERLVALGQIGVNLVIDDFGTQQSPLGCLKLAAFDRVKIDRSFVSGLEHDHADQAIVKSLVNLCAAMKLYVVAVGVETPVQEDVLSELGCYEVQGFLHAPSMRRQDVLPYLRLKAGEAMKRPRCA